MKKDSVLKAQIFLRLISVILSAAAACIVGFDTETEKFLSAFVKKATVKDIDALMVVTIIDSIAAGYNLLQLINSILFYRSEGDKFRFNRKVAWINLFFDQVMAYLCFASNSTATQVSVLAVTGVSKVQWLKVCNSYTKFCIQIGGGIVSGFTATLAMILVSFISAFNLFRFYSPKTFLALKHR